MIVDGASPPPIDEHSSAFGLFNDFDKDIA